ncbi:MAG: hypothetical protein D6814_03095, partial [Calditrichaeota bacterium]
MTQILRQEGNKITVTCASCGGTGVHTVDPVCRACHGSGKVTFVFELANPPVVSCPVCKGRGKTPTEFYCLNCKGVG